MKKNLNYYKKILPNAITFGNVTSGFLALIFTVKQDFILAVWLIFIAAIADALDGMVARLTKTSSKFGVELDSIADVVSFGVAPAFLMYNVELYNQGIYGLIGSLFFLIAGAFRLARFNAELVSFDKEYFLGLPIPLGALTVSFFIIAFYDPATGLSELGKYLAAPLCFFVGLIMMSKIKYDVLPKFTLAGIKEKPFHIAFLAIAVGIVLFTSEKSIFYIFVFVFLFGILRSLIDLISGKKAETNNS